MSERVEIELPTLSDESIARIEREVMSEVRAERRTTASDARTTTAARRRRRWVTGLGVAAAFVIGAVIAPPLLSSLQGVSGTGDSGITGASAPWATDESGGDMSSSDGGAADGGAMSAEGGGVAADPGKAAVEDPSREIITTAQVQLRVADVQDAADEITALAAAHGGYVESADIGAREGETDASMPAPPSEPGSGWISIRIAADDLDEVLTALGDDGEVLRSSVSRQDVTSTAIDLRARIDAAQASVTRLTELMAKSGSVGDLIAAESALSERQALLESYQQHLKSLDEQVALSTVTVQLTERTTATEADPAGFGDGLLAGWNGLIVTLNGLVVALGFLLPWLVIAGAALLVIWLIRRRRRAARTASPTEDR